MAELRSLTIPCQYKQEMLNTMLRDVFVSGLPDRAILDRLFEKDDIDIENTLKIALAIEKAMKGANEIMGKSLEIKKFRAGKNKGQSKFVSQKKNSGKQNCYYSGKREKHCTGCTATDRDKNTCKFKLAKCHFCQKIGHHQRPCYAAKRVLRQTRLNKSR